MRFLKCRCVRQQRRLPLLRGGLRLLLGRGQVVREPRRLRGHLQDGQEVQEHHRRPQHLREPEGAGSVQVQGF